MKRPFSIAASPSGQAAGQLAGRLGQDVTRGVLQVLPAAFVGLTDKSIFTIGGVVYAVALIVQPGWLTECQLVSMTKRRVGGVNNRLQR